MNFTDSGYILLSVAVLAASIPTISYAEENTEQKILMTEWNAHLLDNETIIPVYNCLKDAVDESGNSLYSDEFIIGFIANIEHESKSGIVEYSFSKNHEYGFYLPSGGSAIENTDDIDYLLDWTVSNEGTKENCAKKGSCGVSLVQWSYGRRITYLNKLKQNMGDRTDVTRYDLSVTDMEMILEELSPDGKYYKNIIAAIGSDRSAENYAEAFCDYYFKPRHSDLNMTGTGLSCTERRATAEYLWEIYNSNRLIYKTVNFVY